jgi:hypothetical protein
VYGILGENESDVATLRILVRRLADNPQLKVLKKGYSGCAEMLRKGARQLRDFQYRNCRRFIVCHDADGFDPEPKRREVQNKIIGPSEIRSNFCIVVPVQEIEAWILADIECAVKIFSSWHPSPVSNPEGIQDPKEYLERISKVNKKPLYIHTIHNEKMAGYLDCRKVRQKCPSFKLLAEFVQTKTT